MKSIGRTKSRSFYDFSIGMELKPKDIVIYKRNRDNYSYKGRGYYERKKIKIIMKKTKRKSMQEMIE